MKNKEFIITPSAEKPKTAGEYAVDELKADLSVFSPKTRSLMERQIAGESLSREEAEIMSAERERWWQEKYGFPYRQKAARQELLMKKYSPSEQTRKAHGLQESLFKAFSAGGSAEDGIAKIKEAYREEYPDQLEGIEALFGLMPFLEASKKLDDKKVAGKAERTRMYEELTEYQFLLSHFIESNSDDKEFMGGFWKAMEKLAGQAGLLREFNIIRMGVVTQVATYKIFKSLGEKPVLSSPKEDAFKSIDLWSDNNHAVQIKGGLSDKPALIRTDSMFFPGTEIKDKKNPGGVKHFSSDMFAKAQKFSAKIGEYERIANKKIEGYFLVVPYAKIDFITGEPDASLVDFVKKELGYEDVKKAA